MTNDTEQCPACHGAKLQRDSNGLLQRCPACDGRGQWRKPEDPDAMGVTAPLGPKPPVDDAWKTFLEQEWKKGEDLRRGFCVSPSTPHVVLYPSDGSPPVCMN